jgi:AmiR/NasT family two-component response regulator
MAAEAVDDTSPTSDEALHRTQQLLDTAFDEFDVADVLEAHADLVLDMTERIQQLEQGIESRTIIGKAIGICMERYNISDEQAFQFLTRLSQNHNVKLRVVAAHLLERTASAADAPADRYTRSELPA